MTAKDSLARLAGLLYLTSAGAIAFWYATMQRLEASPAGVLEAVAAERATFQLSLISGAAGVVLFLMLALAFHRLFSPAGKTAATLLVAFVASSVPLSLAGLARQMELLALLDGRHGLAALSPDQLRLQAALAVAGFESLAGIAALFWGLWLFPLGWLAFRSGFAPRLLGLMLMAGGVGYVMMFAGPTLNPDYAQTLIAQAIGWSSGVPAVIGEFGLILWLLVMGARPGWRRAEPAMA